jgi:hypothetical protein
MKRLEYLKEKFNVVSDEELATFVEGLDKDGLEMTELKTRPSKDGKHLLTYYHYPKSDKRKDRKLKYLVNEQLFKDVVDCDPTDHKMYVQWIMKTLINMVGKEYNVEEGVGDSFFVRVVVEDLPKTSENLQLFEGNKRKKAFKVDSKKNYALIDIEDPTNINQYTNLNQLVSAIFPFKPGINLDEFEAKLLHLVELGHGEIPVRDEVGIIFIPTTLQGCEAFSFTNWCTSTPGNGMFQRYTEETDAKADGSPSELLIFIGRDFLEDKSDSIYQLHVESNQFMDERDMSYVGFREDFLNRSIGFKNFMRKYLAKNYKLSIDHNHKENEKNYYKYIMAWGLGEVLFDIIEHDSPTITFKNVEIDIIPKLNRFTRLSGLYLDKVGIKRLRDDIFNIKSLQMLSVPFNNLTELPETIGEARELIFMNLVGNPIKKIPSTIQYLDQSKGGKLRCISIDSKNQNIINELKGYLPSIKIMGVEVD